MPLSPDRSGIPPGEVRYTVEWVLGGKLTGVKRDELRYTTAQEEGMTDSHYGGSRRAGRTKRKPTDFMAETAKQDAERKKQRTSGPNSSTSSKAKKAAAKAQAEIKPAKKKEPVKKKKEPVKKKPTTAPKKKPAAKAKSAVKAKPTKTKVTKRKASATASKKTVAGKKEPKRKTKKEENEAPAQASGQNALELYDKHRREFERILTRLEKVDKFGYFLDDAPPEFDETLPPPLASKHCAQEDEEVSSKQPPAATMALDASVDDNKPVPSMTSGTSAVNEFNSPDEKSDSVQKALTTTCTDAPPASQEVPVAPPTVTSSLQVTTDQADAPAEVTTTGTSTSTKREEPTVLFPEHPPFNWKMVRRRMELGRYVLDREKAEEDERFKVLDPYYRTLGKKRPRRKFAVRVNNQGTKTKKKKASVNPRVINPVGVDWDQFRDDVAGMCDAAIARDDDDPEARDSLTFAAKKVKEVS